MKRNVGALVNTFGAGPRNIYSDIHGSERGFQMRLTTGGDRGWCINQHPLICAAVDRLIPVRRPDQNEKLRRNSDGIAKSRLKLFVEKNAFRETISCDYHIWSIFYCGAPASR